VPLWQEGKSQVHCAESNHSIQQHCDEPAAATSNYTREGILNPFAQTIFERTYAHDTETGKENWDDLATRVTKNVMRAVGVDMRKTLAKDIRQAIAERKFIPAGRYLYSAGRSYHQVCNCLLMRAHDSREGWAEVMNKATMALMTGAGVGCNYSDVRAEHTKIRKTGGLASGPIPLMQMVNEAGRGVMQGGTRRCLPEDAPVTMADGTKKPISEIEVGDLVHTQFGSRKVSNVFDQGEQEVFKITTSKGALYSSANHRWWGTTKMRVPRWITTSKIQPGWKIYRSYTPAVGGASLDKDWMYTLGFYLGNGCAYSTGRTHEVNVQIADAHITDAQVKTIERGMSRFDVRMTINPGHGACTQLRFRSKVLVPLFQKYKHPNKPFSIPEEVWNADSESRSAFLAGWFDADGDVRQDSITRLSNKYAEVRKEARRLLASLGFQTVDHENSMSLSLSARQAELFNNTIRKYSHKYNNLTSTGSLLYSTVLSVESVGNMRTYDIEVEKEHQFVAYDHISHNSAIWAGLRWNHPDIHKFVRFKNWPDEIVSLKAKDFSFPAPLDHTNISVCLDDDFFTAYHDDEDPQHAMAHSVYWTVIEQMLRTGEPGFSVDVDRASGEDLRNACTEVSSRDTDDICNLGSINLDQVETIDEFKAMVELSTAFLLAGSVYSDVPYSDVDKVLSKNRRLGLGLMGIHAWLIKRGKKYGPDEELGLWLNAYSKSGRSANKWADEWGLKRPKKTRAIAPNGTTSIVAETTGGIEPIICVAYKRRYLKGKEYFYQYVVDPVAKRLIAEGVSPDMIEDAYMLAQDVERRVAFQAWMQQYVDHGISSTINLPPWGTEFNNKHRVRDFGSMLIRYLPQLRGITTYPDGSRGGQPITPIPYSEAVEQEGIEMVEEQINVCEIRGGSCGD
jgi:ribonucleoside-diphosphate reductase alpha chain